MRIWLVLGAANAFLAVAAGAFGAHGLKSILDPEMLEIFQTGARYQMYHALGLIAVAFLGRLRASAWADGAGYAFTAGILLFTGSLYVLALTRIKTFGAITPFGGLGFLAGWVMFGIAAWDAV